MDYNLNFYIDFLIIVESFKEVFIIIKNVKFVVMNLKLSPMAIQENIVLNVVHRIQRVKAVLKQLVLCVER